MERNLNVLMNYRRLRHIQRCNNFLKIAPEDVAQHSFYTSILAMIIADEYNAEVDKEQEHNKDKVMQKANVELVLRKALLHDTDEAITSDVPYNVKHSSEDFNKQIEEVISNITEENYQECTELFKTYQRLARDCKKDLEGAIVDLADMLELAMYCQEEVLAGNRYLEGLLTRAVDYSYNKSSDLLLRSRTVNEILIELTSETKDMSIRYKL